MRYFLKLSYNGTPFHGWQIQPNASSVQQTIEEALSTILRAPVSITGAGRTDTGVNAKVMYAHFDLPQEADDKRLHDTRRFLLSINRLCGPAINIEEIFKVHDEAHARFDATLRTYKYFVTFCKSPFLDGISWHSPSPLDKDKMNEAARLLLSTKDFTSFAKLHTDVKTNICDLSHAEWSDWDSPFLPEKGLVFTVSADRFLRNMVRALVGTLVEVGRGKITVEDFKRIIDARDRCSAGTSMPPQALFLWDIKYPYIE